jgi:Ran GTPase-activating protein (RanGAP) involved in mRNA processing and transport
MNKNISDLIIPNLNEATHQNELNLKDMDVKDVRFLSKFLKDYSALKVLDLSNNQLGDDGANQIESVLKQSSNIEKLNLSGNNITPNGL